jgi:hypothetical protein
MIAVLVRPSGLRWLLFSGAVVALRTTSEDQTRILQCLFRMVQRDPTFACRSVWRRPPAGTLVHEASGFQPPVIFSYVSSCAVQKRSCFIPDDINLFLSEILKEPQSYILLLAWSVCKHVLTF